MLMEDENPRGLGGINTPFGEPPRPTLGLLIKGILQVPESPQLFIRACAVVRVGVR